MHAQPFQPAPDSTQYSDTPSEGIRRHLGYEALSRYTNLRRADFKNKIEQMTQRQTRPGRNGRPPGAKEESAIVYVM